MTHRQRLTSIVLACGAVLIGCTPDAYRRDADLQVNKLVRDREQQTLGYKPPANAEGLKKLADAPVPARAYAKIPQTPLPPDTPSPIEPIRIELPHEPLGPQLLLPPGVTPPRRETLGVAAAEQRVHERLELGPPATGRAIQSLDFFRTLEYAVAHSRDYQSRAEDLYLAALDVTLQRHLFEPRPFATQSFTYAGGQRDFNYRSALNAVSTVGVRQQLPYGGEVTAQALVTFVDALNNNTTSGESAELALTGSIPLLRGAGMVNLEPLISSERQLVYEVRTFEEFRRDFVVNIASSYFRLINQRQNVDNTLTNYINTVNLTTRLLEMFGAGRQGYNFLQVQQAQSRQLAQEASLIQAQRDYQSAVDDFKVQIGMPIDQPLDVVPVELNVNVPDVEHSNATQLALRYRLSLQTARDQLDDAKRQIENAKNGLLPGVDLTFDTRLGNRPGSPAKDVDSRDYQYSAGVNIDLPIDRLAERNVYRRALISFERARRGLEQQQDVVVSDVRQAVRAVQTAQRTVEIQQRAIEIAQRQLEYSNELLTQGRAQARDVTDALNSLLAAQNSYDRARVDLQIQVLTFLRDTGTLRVDPDAGAIGHAMDLNVAMKDTATPAATEGQQGG